MQNSYSKLAAATALAVAVFAAPAAQASDKSDLLHDANRTVDALKHDPAFGTARTMLQNARAVYIVPKLVKGGFIFGAEGGDGVLLHRTGHGWSTPKFYGMGSASFGLQAGLEQAELVFIINSDRALRGIEHGELKLGAGAGLTVVNLSSGAEGATTVNGGADRGVDLGFGRLCRPYLQWFGNQGRQGRRRDPGDRPGSRSTAPQSCLGLVKTD